MAQYTPYFGLCFFDIGDNLADLANVTAEMNRFVVIDRQLYGLYSIFGSGVISGWEVVSPSEQSPDNISVEVSPGMGIVNLMAAETTFSTTVDSLPPNQIVYIFAQITSQTAINRTVRFFYGRTEVASNAILIATVITADNGIVSIDNTVRTEIGFQRIIEDEIKQHHHRGVPTKIDLANETKGQLPGNKIGDVSADIVKRGKFTVDRIPLIDHASLTGIGLFSHPEIDAMLSKIEADPEEQRLVEITLTNTLREYIFLKYKYPDCDTHFLNELVYIPGISPDNWVDWDATTANINLATGCISGKAVSEGQQLSVRWATKTALQNVADKGNVVIDSTGVSLQRGDIDTLLVEGFESANDGGAIPGFVASVEAVNSSTGVTADSNVKTEENKSGKFNINQQTRGTFIKTFTPAQDWTEWDRLTVNVKCTTASHGPVYMYFQNSAGEQSSVMQLLAEDEVTTNPDPLMVGFAERTFVLSGWANRSSVTQIVIIVDDVASDYGFWLDDIRLRKSQDYVPQGYVRYRYNASERVVYNSLIYDTILPTGTDVKARIRVADTEADLSDALFSPYLKSDDTFVYKGKWVEIDVQLYANTSVTYTPTLASLELGITAQSSENGFIVDTSAQWANGDASNITFIDNGGTARIRTPVTVGDYVFLNEEQISEIDDGKKPVFGIGSQNLPPSEWQAYNALFDASVEPSMSNPLSVVRTNDRRYICCDTENHRILIFSQDGSLIRAFCGMNEDVVQGQEDIIGVTATYNKDTGILWLGFTKQITLTLASFSKIKVTIGAKQFTLAEEGDNATLSGSVSGRVIPVYLTDDHQTMLNGSTDTITVMYDTDLSPRFNNLYANKEVHLFSAPVSYHDYIYYPVYCVEARNKENKYWICNATKLPFVGSTEPSTPSTRQLYLFDPDEDTNTYTNSVYFMKEFGGMVLETDSGDTYVVGVDINRNGFVYLNPMGSSPVTVYAAPTNNYPNAIDIDAQGKLWVAESSANSRGGRIIQMDDYGNLLNAFGEVYTKINSLMVLNSGNLLIGC